MDEQRMILDQLMGSNRNGENVKLKKFTDPDVCPFYLCGMCPHEKFTNTKFSIGDCSKYHSPALRTQYEADVAKSGKDYGFEKKLVVYLRELIDDCDRKIDRNIERLMMNTEVDVLETTAKVDEELKVLVKQVESLAEEGKIEDSLLLNKKIEELRANRPKDLAERMNPKDLLVPGEEIWQGAEAYVPQIISIMRAQPHSQIQKLRVCPICSAFLSIFDNDRRLADHFSGKMHLGFLEMRKKLKELEDKLSLAQNRQRDRDNTQVDRLREVAENDRERERERDRKYREKDLDRGRDRDRDRERDRRGDRDRDRDRGRDRDRDRDRERRHRSRERERSRERDRGSSRERRRHRERERSRERNSGSD